MYSGSGYVSTITFVSMRCRERSRPRLQRVATAASPARAIRTQSVNGVANCSASWGLGLRNGPGCEARCSTGSRSFASTRGRMPRTVAAGRGFSGAEKAVVSGHSGEASARDAIRRQCRCQVKSSRLRYLEDASRSRVAVIAVGEVRLGAGSLEEERQPAADGQRLEAYVGG